MHSFHGQGKSTAWHRCPLCKKTIRLNELDEHLKWVHPGRRLEANGVLPNFDLQEERERQAEIEDQKRERLGARRRSGAIHIEPFECGWCYQQVFRVTQKNGYYRYYDDRELKYKHRCTRPAGWQPDKG